MLSLNDNILHFSGRHIGGMESGLHDLSPEDIGFTVAGEAKLYDGALV